MNANRLLKNSQKDLSNTYNIVFSRRGCGRSAYYHYYLFKRAYDKERKKLMGEIILIISIALILTVVSSFWLGYAYGKLRTIKSYETSQKQIFIDYMSQGEKEKDNETDTD